IKSIGTAAISEAFGLNSTERGIVNFAAEALSLKYSRNQETEADNMGTELMARAGYDPNEAVKVWEKMSSLSKSSTPEFMSTHPSHESRIENLHGIAETVYPLYQKAIK
ncbi:MAG: M48 family metalloprotease, partial [Treponema sp.]|nr:M48 family metalloprotease [Treponema sp.]